MTLIEKEWLEDLLLAHEQNARSIQRSFEASGRKLRFSYADGIRTAYADVGLCPSVDAVVVVRCKDCKYWNPHNKYCEGIGNWFGIADEWSDNGFCYKAERRTE